MKNFYFVDDNKQNKSILFILREIWKILIEELLKKGIENIQCFLNMIIPEISKIIINNEKSMINKNERYEFENECNQVIEKSILNYKDYYSNYIKNNKKILDYNIKSIIQETSNFIS